MQIAICGPGRAGKDDASNWFKEHTSLRYVESTSQAATSLVFKQLANKYGYKSVEECFADRHSHRVEWARIIWAHNSIHFGNGITLYTDMLEHSDILNGIRKAGELHICRLRNLIDLAIWIERPGKTEVGSMTLTASHCDITVINDESSKTYPARFFGKLTTLAAALGVLKPTKAHKQ